MFCVDILCNEAKTLFDSGGITAVLQCQKCIPMSCKVISSISILEQWDTIFANYLSIRLGNCE